MSNVDRIVELLAKRREARAIKDWAASDAIRNELDELGLFVFDKKDGETEMLRSKDDYFVHMEKAGLNNGITFKSRRHYVEWRIQQDIVAERRLDAWVYSMQQSESYKKATHDSAREDTSDGHDGQ